ncbi:hypothetical protein [uncultured Alcanivorax sp.]|uniref:hypothetical protein n=1 Tax=uncultured Alcanivorax sp. TaxID=191215 RepID=UPI0025FCD4FD|nr:hypothetical protein [uncultured Alcanivorax sp.]
MALINCPECSGTVSSNANACPHCGAAIKKRNMAWLWIVILAVVSFVVFAVIRGSDPEVQAKREAKAAYDLCMDMYRESGDPLAKLACEKMGKDFRDEYGSYP